MATTATLGDSGIVFNGPVDDAGCSWGWDDSSNVTGPKPAPREETGDRPYRDGQWDGTGFYGARQREISGEVIAPDHGSLHVAEQRLRDAVGVDLFRLLLSEPGLADSFQMVRQSGELRWSEAPDGISATYSIGLYAPDPLAYATTDMSFTLGLPSVSGGLTWPATWPATWNATVTSGSAMLMNASRMAVPLRLRFTGPLTRAQVSNPDTGEVLRLDRPDGLPLLTAGEFLTVDTGRHAVLLNGNASRRSWLYGDWLLVAPGSSRLSFAGSGDPSAQLSGSFTPVRL